MISLGETKIFLFIFFHMKQRKYIIYPIKIRRRRKKFRNNRGNKKIISLFLV